MPRDSDPYLVEAAAKVLDVLELFRSDGEMGLAEVASRLGMVKSTAFRLLYTLEKKGYIERTEGRGFRRRKRYRIGFATIDASTPFVVEVNRAIAAEAERLGIDLSFAYNEFDRTRTVDNVVQFLRAGIDLLFEYNPDEHISHVVADHCARANIPIIAITFPIPGARLFGINSYRAGLTGGEGLGQHVVRVWEGKVEAVLLLDIVGHSPAQQARMSGMLDGLRRMVPAPDEIVTHVHCDRGEESADRVVAAFLRRSPRLRRLAVMSYNDHNAIQAVRAIEDAGRGDHALVLSQGAVTAAREELRRLRSPLWAAVAHFPEQFGRRLIPFALRVLHGESAPASVTVEHALLTRANLRQHYP